MPSTSRHAYIHEDHVGAVPAYLVDRFTAVCRLPHDLEVRLGRSTAAKPGPHQLLVVGDQRPGSSSRPPPRRPAPGCGACTRNPSSVGRALDLTAVEPHSLSHPLPVLARPCHGSCPVVGVVGRPPKSTTSTTTSSRPGADSGAHGCGGRRAAVRWSMLPGRYGSRQVHAGGKVLGSSLDTGGRLLAPPHAARYPRRSTSPSRGLGDRETSGSSASSDWTSSPPR